MWALCKSGKRVILISVKMCCALILFTFCHPIKSTKEFSKKENLPLVPFEFKTWQFIAGSGRQRFIGNGMAAIPKIC